MLNKVSWSLCRKNFRSSHLTSGTNTPLKGVNYDGASWIRLVDGLQRICLLIKQFCHWLLEISLFGCIWLTSSKYTNFHCMHAVLNAASYWYVLIYFFIFCFSFIFFLWSTGDQTQGLRYARQILYYWARPQPFYISVW